MARDSMARLICEHSSCTQPHDFVNSHSSIAVLQRVDKSGYTFFQCEEGQEYNFVNWQHWHCSHEHMKENFATCINEHYTEGNLHPISGGGTTILHKVVLGSSLCCKVCQQPLTDVAYRLCLTMCTPVNHVPDASMEETGEWCCCLDHAKQSALSTISNLNQIAIE